MTAITHRQSNRKIIVNKSKKGNKTGSLNLGTNHKLKNAREIYLRCWWRLISTFGVTQYFFIFLLQFPCKIEKKLPNQCHHQVSNFREALLCREKSFVYLWERIVSERPEAEKFRTLVESHFSSCAQMLWSKQWW